MTIAEAIEILKKDRGLCLFNPITGEEKPMSEDCRKSAEAYALAIEALEKQIAENKEEATAKCGEWISLGYRPGPFKHPFSEDYKCSACGHEIYTVMWTPPEYCPACKSFMKNGGMRFVESLETDGGKPDER